MIQTISALKIFVILPHLYKIRYRFFSASWTASCQTSTSTKTFWCSNQNLFSQNGWIIRLVSTKSPYYWKTCEKLHSKFASKMNKALLMKISKILAKLWTNSLRINTLKVCRKLLIYQSAWFIRSLCSFKLSLLFKLSLNWTCSWCFTQKLHGSLLTYHVS